MPKEVDVFTDHNAHLTEFTNEVLRDLGRNGAAPWDYRKAAVEILVNRKSVYAKHEELQEFIHELEIELDGIVFEHPAPSGPGPLTSSVTTATMQGDDTLDMEVLRKAETDRQKEDTEPKNSFWENPEYRAKMKIAQDARYARERETRLAITA